MNKMTYETVEIKTIGLDKADVIVTSPIGVETTAKNPVVELPKVPMD